MAAGIEILKRGGNAADAAAATILALSVTDSRSFCFGGEVPIMVYDARTKGVTVIAGQGAAPRLATREEFVRRGGIPLKGIEAAAVPAGARRLPHPARPVRHDDLHPGRHPDAADPRPPARREPWHADFARTLETLVAAEAMAYPGGPDGRPIDRRGGSDWSPTPSTAGRSPVASTPGRGPTAGSSATPTWPPTRRGSRSRSPPPIAAGPSTSAEPGPRDPACSRHCRSSRASTSRRWAATGPRRSTRSSRR